MIDHVIRLDLLQSVLGELVETGTGETVLWCYGEPPFDGGDLISLRVLSGPTAEQTFARGYNLQPPSEIVLTIDATPGKLARMVVNSIPYQHEVAALDTPATVRAALIAAVQTDPEAAFTAVAHADADKLRLVPAALGSIWAARITGPLTADVTLADALVKVTKSRRRVVVNVQAYSKTKTVRGGAAKMTARALAVLESPAAAQALQESTIGIYGMSSPVDLSAIAGAHWETRSAFDLILNIQAVTITPVYQIGQLAGGFTGHTAAHSFNVELAS